MPDESSQKMVDLVMKVSRRSADDSAFRETALHDADKALEEVADGNNVNNRLNISFVDSDQKTKIVIALPPAIGGEFSDADLEAVAGGGKSQHTNCSGSGDTCVSVSQSPSNSSTQIHSSEVEI